MCSCLPLPLVLSFLRSGFKREHCFCTAIWSQIVIWYKKDDVTKKNRLSVTSCLEFVTKKACLFAIQILDRKHESEHKKLDVCVSWILL